jgi:hypothetical protein
VVLLVVLLVVVLLGVVARDPFKKLAGTLS